MLSLCYRCFLIQKARLAFLLCANVGESAVREIVRVPRRSIINSVDFRGGRTGEGAWVQSTCKTNVKHIFEKIWYFIFHTCCSILTGVTNLLFPFPLLSHGSPQPAWARNSHSKSRSRKAVVSACRAWGSCFVLLGGLGGSLLTNIQRDRG